MKTLTFITGNAEKAAQLERHLAYPVEHKKLDIPEIQSLDLETVARDKARRAYEILGSPVLVEDTALTFHALEELPGPFIKWFLGTLGNEGLARLLDGYDDRSATAAVCFALCDGNTIEIFKAERVGRISAHPKGARGFGWDPIFIPEGHEKTWGEMDEKEQNETSMRRVALQKLAAYLECE